MHEVAVRRGGVRRPTRRTASRAAGMAALVVAVALVATACVANGSWSVLAPATPDAPVGDVTAGFDAVSCTRDDFCMAVGAARTPAAPWPLYGDNPVVQVFDGSGWTTVADPVELDPDDEFGGLWGVAVRDVSCWASDGCLAVVELSWDDDTEYEVYRWDGAGWADTGSTWWPPADPILDCAPDGTCLLADRDGNLAVYDGASWTELTVPDSLDAFLVEEVTCGAADNCVVVTLDSAFRFDGVALAAVDVPGCAVDEGCWRSVDCTSSAHCLLVGGSFGAVRAARWDGSVWAPIPTPIGATFLGRVACASSVECLVDGRRLTPTGTEPITWAFPGVNWYAKPVAPVPVVADLSCAPRLCASVGSSSLAPGTTALAAAAYRWTDDQR